MRLPAAIRKAGCSFGNGCTISLVNTGPQLIRPAAPAERNWLPLAIAAAIVLVVTVLLVLVFEHGKGALNATPIDAAPASYAANLPITGLAMSQAANFIGGKVTYLDGHIANTGNRTVTGITVQVLFRDYANEVVQNETQPLKFIRIRQPYVDLEPVSAGPLTPGGGRDFRLIFDTVADNWNGAYPEIRILHVETK
jgi:hypothetical protein